MINVPCPSCGRVHHADPAHVGKLLRCAACGKTVTILDESSSRPIATGPTTSVITSSKRVEIHIDPQKIPWDKLGLIAAAVLMIVALYERNTKSEPMLHRSLATGARLRSDTHTSGHGVLKIDDLGGDDAVLKLVSEAAGRAVRTVFVTKDSTVDLDGIEPGRYRVLFVFGEDWDRQQGRFTRVDAYYEVGETLSFVEEQKPDRIEFTREEITLDTHISGTVPRLTLSKEAFDRE